MKRKLASIVLMPLLAIGGLLGCGGHEEESKRTEPPLDLGLVSLESGVAFPLDSYGVSLEEGKLTTRAFDILMQRCLQRFGFDVPLPEDPVGPPHQPLDWRFGLISAEDAKQYGYAGPPAPQQGMLFQNLVPDEAMPVLLGEGEHIVAGQEVPEEGCQGEADRKLAEGGVALSEADVIEGLRREAARLAREDSRVVPLLAEWSTCMKQNGYEFEHPDDAYLHWNNSRHESGDPNAPVSQAEKDAAWTDVACKRDTLLLRTWQAAVLAYEEVLIEENQDEIAQAERSIQTMIDNANRIIAGE